jgi:hypothetical protein
MHTGKGAAPAEHLLRSESEVEAGRVAKVVLVVIALRPEILQPGMY